MLPGKLYYIYMYIYLLSVFLQSSLEYFPREKYSQICGLNLASGTNLENSSTNNERHLHVNLECFEQPHKSGWLRVFYSPWCSLIIRKYFSLYQLNTKRCLVHHNMLLSEFIFFKILWKCSSCRSDIYGRLCWYGIDGIRISK